MSKFLWFNKQRVTVEDMTNVQQWNIEGLTNQYGALCNKGVVRGNDTQILGYHTMYMSPYQDLFLNPLDLVFTQNGTGFDIIVPGSLLANSAFFAIDAHGRLIKIHQPVTYDSTVSADMTRSSGNISIPFTSPSNQYFYVWIKYKPVIDTTITKTNKDGVVFEYKEIGGYDIVVTDSATDVAYNTMVPNTTDDWVFLGKIVRDIGTYAQTYYYDEVVYAGVADTSVNIKVDSTQIPTTYSDGEDKSLADHINAVGTGTISRNNPHGIHPDNMAQVDNDNIADNSISETKLQNDSISQSKMQDNSVGTAEIIDRNITPLKIQLGFNVIPPGCVLPFAGSIVPNSSWLLCDGSEKLIADYQELYAVIGDTYGSPTVGTKFKLPDYRGYFLRGIGTNEDGTAGETLVGNKQEDMLESHSHIFAENPGVPGSYVVARITAITTNNGGAASTGATGGVETRPKNIGVLYIISTGR